jgi:hypothetical protein
MWFFFFILAIIGVIILLFHIMLQLNELEKQVTALTEKIRKHYEIT